MTGALPRVAMGLEYDGRPYQGWQSQANGATVQDALEMALGQVAAAPVRVHCAGRTDTGVHALNQVVHFDPPTARPLSAWQRGVNAHLPDSIAVCWVAQVDQAFHARFCAQSRAYRYVLLNRPQRPGLLAGRVGWHHRRLDETVMNTALHQLLGTHDFSSFRAAQCQARSPVRTLRRAQVKRTGDLLVFDFEADGFLHHMIRNIVGAAVAVGAGTLPVTGLATLLRERNRTYAPPTFSPAGLYFAGADYDPRWGLPQVGAGGTAIVEELQCR